MFYATFLNTTGGPQDLRWIVFIYKADSPSRIMGETTLSPATIPANTSEQLSQGYWKLPATGPCDFFLARVAQFDANNQQSLFTTPDGKVFEKGFSLCQ